MVEQFEQRIHGIGYALMIIDPADGFIDFAFDGDGDLKAVTVHVPAFVAIGQTWQGVCSFKAKFFGQTSSHESIKAWSLLRCKLFQSGNVSQQHADAITGFAHAEDVAQAEIDNGYHADHGTDEEPAQDQYY